MRRIFSWVLVALATAAGGISAQVVDADPGRAVRTRADLEQLLEQHRQALAGSGVSGAERTRLAIDTLTIRRRLEQGDFRLGDRVVLFIEGEPNQPDTLTVDRGPIVTVPRFGEVSLQGVLRSEVQEHMSVELRRFIRDPVVRAEGLMRISIQGAVGAAGFYHVPADMLLSDVIMEAGGFATAADIEDVTLQRGAEILMEAEAVQERLREGYSLDQLNLQAGDQIFVDTRRGSFWGTLALVVGTASSVVLLVLQLRGTGG